MKLLLLALIGLALFGAVSALTPIVACGSVTMAGAYDLTVNLTSTTAASCINVTAADVSIDCSNALGGYQTIIGNNSTATYGIYVSNVNDVNISDCQIQNYTYDVYVKGGNSGNFNNDTFNSSYVSGAALYLPNSNFTVINASTFNTTASTDYGLYSTGASNNVTVANSTLWSKGTTTYGIYLASAVQNWTIFNNTISEIDTSQGAGVSFNGNSVRSTFTNNNFTGNSSGGQIQGIVFFSTGSATYDNISNNQFMVNVTATGNAVGMSYFNNAANNETISNNTFTIIDISTLTEYGLFSPVSGSNDTVIGNIFNITNISGSKGYGIYLIHPINGSVFDNNTIYDNSALQAIFSNLAVGNNFTGNNISTLSGEDIDLNASNNNLLVNNTLNATTGNAIIIAAVSDNETIANNTISTTGSSGYGIYLLSSSQNDTLFNNTINTTGTSSPAIYLAASTVNFTNITRNTINVSGPLAQGINITSTAAQPGSNLITNNTIWVNASNNGTGIVIAAASGNNSIYWNNFTSAYYFINDSNGSNYYNTTVAGIAEGNIYANYSLYTTGGGWTTSNSNNWANGGTKYPANATNTPGIFTANTPFPDNDSGPWIPASSTGSGLFSQILTSVYAWHWGTVVAGNFIPQAGPYGWHWAVWNKGDSVLVMNGSPYGFNWVPE